MGAHSSFFSVSELRNRSLSKFREYHPHKEITKKISTFFPFGRNEFEISKFSKIAKNLKMGVVFESDLEFGKNFVFNPCAPICHFLNYPTDHSQNLPKFKEYHIRKKSRKKLSIFIVIFVLR